MCAETRKDDYGVVLSSVDTSKQESAGAALEKAFRFDAKTAGTILKNTPIVVFEDLTEAVGKLVLEKMKPLSEAGCKLELVQAPFETKRKMTWPKPHLFVRQAQEEAAKVEAEPPTEQAGSVGTVRITCPKCGAQFDFRPGAPEVLAEPAPPAEAPLEEPAAEPVEEIEEAPFEEPAAEPVEEIEQAPFEEPAAEPVEEIEQAPFEEPAAAPVEEIEQAPLEEAASADGIMDLDEFEASLDEIDFENPPADSGGEEEPDALSGAQAVEVEVPETTPEEVAPEPPVAGPEMEVPPVPADEGEGDGMYRVILSKMRSDKMRSDAAEIIASVQGISKEEALNASGKLIITAAKNVTEARANEIKNMFTEKGVKAIVSKRK